MTAFLDTPALNGATSIGASRTLAAQTLSAGTGRKFVVCSSTESATKDTTAVTFDGAPCAWFGTVVQGVNRLTWFYYDIPDALGAGSYDWVFTFSSATATGHMVAAWITSGDTPGAPQLVTNGVASGGVITAAIAANNGDALLSTAMSENSSGTSWSFASSPSVIANNSMSNAAGNRFGKAHGAATSTATVTATWTYSNSTDPLAACIVNTTPAAPSGPTTRRPTFLRAVRRLAQRYLPSRVWTGAVKVAGAPEPPAPGIPLDAADSRRRRRRIVVA